VLHRIDNTTGYRATDFCPREAVYFEWFMPGTEPTEFCPVHNPFDRIFTDALGVGAPPGGRH
jgi:hypothetical protein